MDNGLYGSVYNPDVLSCIANLSSDEVFTPPEIANQILDLLPQELFENPDTTFLDPACKSGVFLREIAKRLIVGLEKQIPDLDKRVNHIFTKQLFGISITELTSLLSRRSLYCSKYPDSDFSLVKFRNPEGNILFRKVKHLFNDGKNCSYCGASIKEYGNRGAGLESHAYQFIHVDNPDDLFNMKFDVIISNPPYQLSDGGHGPSAMPIYQKFIRQAKKLNPRYISMIVPSRWFSGGRGLDDFRDEMLHDDRLQVLHDYFDASKVFPGVEIKGGVCYFLWSRDEHGDCQITTYRTDGSESLSKRPLLEDGLSTFLRNVEQISILHKVRSVGENSFQDIVTPNDPYGFDVREEGSYKRIKPTFTKTPFENAVEFYYNGWRKEGLGYLSIDDVHKNKEFVDKYKIFVPKAWGTGNPQTDWLNAAFIVGPHSASTETYLTVGPFETEEEAENAMSYIHTKFFHFMVAMVKITQNAMRNIYEMVPLQDFSKSWTDEELFEKYGLTEDEVSFIMSTTRTSEVEE